MIFDGIALGNWYVLFLIFDSLWKGEEPVKIEIFFLEEKRKCVDDHFQGHSSVSQI